MFFIKQMEHTITLHPSFFGPRIQDYLVSQLYRDMEGTNTGDFYIVAIMSEPQASEGMTVPGSGFATYTVYFKAVIWKPFKGEVLDGLVSKVTATGIFVEMGPLTAFIALASMPPAMKYDGNAAPPAFVEYQQDAGPITIAEGTGIRVRIRGIRAEKGQMYAIATINDDFLGYGITSSLSLLRLITPRIAPSDEYILKTGARSTISPYTRSANIYRLVLLSGRHQCPAPEGSTIEQPRESRRLKKASATVKMTGGIAVGANPRKSFQMSDLDEGEELANLQWV